uniref:Uncharacterized protein n=1 Tax=Rhizophora mucronata TaxID=61149 RepID=A0A2P2LTJ6_RHIMU
MCLFQMGRRILSMNTYASCYKYIFKSSLRVK